MRQLHPLPIAAAVVLALAGGTAFAQATGGAGGTGGSTTTSSTTTTSGGNTGTTTTTSSPRGTVAQPGNAVRTESSGSTPALRQDTTARVATPPATGGSGDGSSSETVGTGASSVNSTTTTTTSTSPRSAETAVDVSRGVDTPAPGSAVGLSPGQTSSGTAPGNSSSGIGAPSNSLGVAGSGVGTSTTTTTGTGFDGNTGTGTTSGVPVFGGAGGFVVPSNAGFVGGTSVSGGSDINANGERSGGAMIGGTGGNMAANVQARPATPLYDATTRAATSRELQRRQRGQSPRIIGLAPRTDNDLTHQMPDDPIIRY